MKWKMAGLLTAGAMMLTPSLAFACDTVMGFRFWHTGGQGVMVNPGLHLVPGEDGGETGLIFSVDLGVPVGEKAVVAPLLGYCKYGDFGEIVFGGGAAVNIFNNAAGTIGLNVQAGLTYDSYEGGNEQSIPIGLMGAYSASETASILFGAGMSGYRYSEDFGGESFSETDFDPYATGGAELMTGSMSLFATIVLFFYDGGTDTAFNVGAGIPLG